MNFVQGTVDRPLTAIQMSTIDSPSATVRACAACAFVYAKVK